MIGLSEAAVSGDVPEVDSVHHRLKTATCQDCGWNGPVEDMLEFRHLYLRVHPGDVMPGGDCPEEGCGGAAMLDLRAHAGGPRMQPVCDTCGGTGVQVDAWAPWDAQAQRWELHSTVEAAAICADCDVECSYSMKPATEAP